MYANAIVLQVVHFEPTNRFLLCPIATTSPACFSVKNDLVQSNFLESNHGNRLRLQQKTMTRDGPSFSKETFRRVLRDES